MDMSRLSRFGKTYTKVVGSRLIICCKALSQHVSNAGILSSNYGSTTREKYSNKMACDNRDCPFYELQNENGSFSAAEIKCIITDVVQQVAFHEGEVLFHQGQPSTSLYSVTSGMVKIGCHTCDGGEQIVGLSSPGNLLVGLQSLNNERYAYSATATTEVQACKINHRLLLARVQDTGDVAIRLIDAVNAQLTHTRALVQVLVHKSAAAKIAAFVLLMTPKSQQRGSRFSVPFSRMEIANMLGMSEETVSRLMANMQSS